MKRVFICVFLAVMTLAAVAQVGMGRRVIELDGVKAEESRAMRPDTVMPNGEWQRVVQTEMTAKECFKYMRQAMAKVMPDYQRNVQLEDSTDCKLVVTVALPLMAKTVNGYWYQGFYNLTLTLAMKDNRYRVSGENVKCQTGLNVPGADNSQGLSFGIVSKDTNGGMQRDMRWKAGQLVALIDRTMKKQKADNEW